MIYLQLALTCGACVGIVVYLLWFGIKYQQQRHAKNTSWGWFETASGPLMRRRVNGLIETREMTPDEMHHYMGSRISGW